MITVAIERTIHDGIAELLQAIEVKHGVRVNSVAANWIDASSVHEPRFILAELTLSTTTSVRK